MYDTEVRDITDEMGTFILPIAKDAKNTGIVVTPAQVFGISNKSSAPNEAIRFLNYFLNDIEAGKVLGQARAIPPSAPVREACMAASLINEDVLLATDYAQTHRGYTPNQISTNSEITDAVKDAVEKVAHDASTVNAAADQAFKLIEDILASRK
jgi:oligogalacturonide transport system substrate-binding protein